MGRDKVNAVGQAPGTKLYLEFSVPGIKGSAVTAITAIAGTPSIRVILFVSKTGG